MSDIIVRPVASKADKKAFVELAYRLNLADPNWVPPLKDEVRGPDHARQEPLVRACRGGLLPRLPARRRGAPVGRISAQVDALVLEHMGAGLGQWGMFEAEDEAAAHALLAAAEAWLRGKGMTRAMGPFSLGIWDEPGLLVKGHDHPPMVMMGHNKADYQGWIEARGLCRRQGPLHLRRPVDRPFPPLIERIVASGEKNRASASARSTRAASTRRRP